jgi:hypothetical protein
VSRSARTAEFERMTRFELATSTVEQSVALGAAQNCTAHG